MQNNLGRMADYLDQVCDWHWPPG